MSLFLLPLHIFHTFSSFNFVPSHLNIQCSIFWCNLHKMLLTTSYISCSVYATDWCCSRCAKFCLGTTKPPIFWTFHISSTNKIWKSIWLLWYTFSSCILAETVAELHVVETKRILKRKKKEKEPDTWVEALVHLAWFLLPNHCQQQMPLWKLYEAPKTGQEP